MDERQGDRRSGAGRREGDVAQETANALTAREFEILHEQIDLLQTKVDALTADREKALRYGIGILGTVVLGLVGWIGGLLAPLLKGH